MTKEEIKKTSLLVKIVKTLVVVVLIMVLLMLMKVMFFPLLRGERGTRTDVGGSLGIVVGGEEVSVSFDSYAGEQVIDNDLEEINRVKGDS